MTADLNSSPDSTGSKAWPVVAAILIFALVAGATSWLYMRNNPVISTDNSTTTATTATPETTKTTDLDANDPVVTSGTNITTSISDMDSQMAQMDADLKSTDDNSPTL